MPPARSEDCTDQAVPFRFPVGRQVSVTEDFLPAGPALFAQAVQPCLVGQARQHAFLVVHGVCSSSCRAKACRKKTAGLRPAVFLRVKGGNDYTKNIQVSRANSGIRMPTDQAM